ncbi:MAG: patatin-like phospholipase family protein [Rhodospirillaceae bacterium]|nr:patatin-like phospholipase family protein [Rhodospirillaceae bacterium]
MKQRVFVAFSGGGAKGIVHVAALKALEQSAVQFAGLAGTSAGSIVATLAAAGFTADDLINPGNEHTILAKLTTIDTSIQRVTDLFGRGGWARIKVFRWLTRHRWIFGTALVGAWVLPLLLTWAATKIAPSYTFWVACISFVVIGTAVWFVYRRIVGGLANLSKLRTALGQLLQEKMFPQEKDRVVRMSDFGRGDLPSLKIVSANLSQGRLHLFSPERTPLTPVADAVAASLCLPIIFAPWPIDNELHVDGGIVSNLPAWPFDEERELDPGAITIAVEIEDAPDTDAVHPHQWMGAAVRTALFGSGELNTRVSGPTERLALPTKIDVLDFDVTGEMARREVKNVSQAAKVWLAKRLTRLPAIYRDACQVAQSLAEDGLGLSPGGRGTAHRVRVAVGRLDRGYTRSLRFSYCVGFDDDADEAMLVPLEGSVAGLAWADKESRLEIYPLQPFFDLPGDGNRLRRKVRWPSSAWIMCIPILDKSTGEPRLLVQLDGNSPLNQDDATATAMDVVEGAVKDFFDLVLKELKDLEDSNGPQEPHV